MANWHMAKRHMAKRRIPIVDNCLIFGKMVGHFFGYFEKIMMQQKLSFSKHDLGINTIF